MMIMSRLPPSRPRLPIKYLLITHLTTLFSPLHFMNPTFHSHKVLPSQYGYDNIKRSTAPTSDQTSNYASLKGRSMLSNRTNPSLCIPLASITAPSTHKSEAISPTTAFSLRRVLQSPKSPNMWDGRVGSPFHRPAFLKACPALLLCIRHRMACIATNLNTHFAVEAN